MFGDSIALAELLAHVEDARTDESVAPVLKLVDLVKLYTARLEQLGVKQQSRLTVQTLRIVFFPMSQISVLTERVVMCCLHLPVMWVQLCV